MESRVKEYYATDIDTNTTSNQATRSSRNAKLYKQIYGKYDDLDNLPIEDNTNEIDMEKLRELVLNNNSSKEEKEIKEELNILEQRKRRIDEQKIYDINKILEKAKYENNKLKESTTNISKPKTDLLATLKSTELSLEEINKAKAKYQEMLTKEQEETITEELSTTREIKYKKLIENTSEEDTTKEELNNTNSLSFDLFEDLKPTGNTITTKPITSDLLKHTNTNQIKIDTSQIKSDIHSGDTSDIDIIKDMPYTNKTESPKESDFFTNAYQFSEKDFSDNEDDEFFDTPKRGGLFKILLLILAIIVFVGVIIYFVGTYGLGIS